MSRQKTKTSSQSFDTAAVLRANAEKLTAALDSIELHGDGEHPTTVQELARLSQALTAVCAELRQLAKAETRAVESLPLDQLIARLKGLPEDQRVRIGRDLAGLDDQTSLLT